MNITSPEPLNDKIELTKEEIEQAVTYWMLHEWQRIFIGPLAVTVGTLGDFRGKGELKPLPTAPGN